MSGWLGNVNLPSLPPHPPPSLPVKLGGTKPEKEIMGGEGGCVCVCVYPGRGNEGPRVERGAVWAEDGADPVSPTPLSSMGGVSVLIDDGLSRDNGYPWSQPDLGGRREREGLKDGSDDPTDTGWSPHFP